MRTCSFKKAIIPFSVIAFFIQLFSAYSCNSGAQNGDKEKVVSVEPVKTKTVRTKPQSSYADTLIINSSAAVFYNPDSLQFEKIKNMINPQELESITHEYFFQMRNARMVIKKNFPKLDIIETTKARYLLFVKSSQRNVCIDLDSRKEISGIFLFNGIKDPLQIDMMNIDTELGFYFNN